MSIDGLHENHLPASKEDNIHLLPDEDIKTLARGCSLRGLRPSQVCRVMDEKADAKAEALIAEHRHKWRQEADMQLNVTNFEARVRSTPGILSQIRMELLRESQLHSNNSTALDRFCQAKRHRCPLLPISESGRESGSDLGSDLHNSNTSAADTYGSIWKASCMH